MDVQSKKLDRGIYVRGNIFWIRYADADGKLRREPGGATLTQAQAKLKTRREQKQKGIRPQLRPDKLRARREQKAHTFSTWINEASDYHAKHSSEDHAYDFERKCVYLRQEFADTPIADMTAARIESWMEEAAEGGVTGSKEWGSATWNRYHACFSSIFALADQRAVKGNLPPIPNPMRHVKRKTEKGKERYWSTEEERRIIESTKKRFPNTGYEDAFILAVEVGYRKSEQLRAVVGDYNPETHKIVIHQRKTETTPPERYVPLSDEGLAAYERLADGKKPGEPLLTLKSRYKGEPMTDIQPWFVDVLSEAGITDDAASWHVCRHTFCSRLCAVGVPVTVVKEYAGHTDIRTTMKYTHGIEGESDVRAREAMNKGRSKQPSEMEALRQQLAALSAQLSSLTQTANRD